MKSGTIRDPNASILQAQTIMCGLQQIHLDPRSNTVLFKHSSRDDFVTGKLGDYVTPERDSSHIYIDTITGQSNIRTNMENLYINHLTVKNLTNTVLNGVQINCTDITALNTVTATNGKLSYIASNAISAFTVSANVGTFGNIDAFMEQTNNMLITINAAL